MRLHFDTTLFGSPAALRITTGARNLPTTVHLFAATPGPNDPPDVVWHMIDDVAMARAVHDAIERVLAARKAPIPDIEIERTLSDVLGSPLFDGLRVTMGWTIADGAAALVALDIRDEDGAHQDVPAWLWPLAQDVYAYHAEAEYADRPRSAGRAIPPEDVAAEIDTGIAAMWPATKQAAE
jgi:hypothetical protein